MSKKSTAMLGLYHQLLSGEVIVKDNATGYGITSRSFSRYIADLREFIDNQEVSGESSGELVYDRRLKGYILKSRSTVSLTNSEVLAVSKILLESRAFKKNEIKAIIQKIVFGSVTKSKRKTIEALTANELHHYNETQHNKRSKKSFLPTLWELSQAIRTQSVVTISYERSDGEMRKRDVEPVGIMFSEFYFYLTAFIEDIDKEKAFDNKDDPFPTIYRIDRIKKLTVTDKHFDIPYSRRFEEGEFRNRIQFMQGGRLRTLRFRYYGTNVEHVLDRLPTAKIVKEEENSFVISAEVFGDGVDIWIRSHGNLIELLD